MASPSPALSTCVLARITGYVNDWPVVRLARRAPVPQDESAKPEPAPAPDPAIEPDEGGRETAD